MRSNCVRCANTVYRADALFAASRTWGLSLNLNKGLAGTPPEVLAAAADTATNSAVLEAFALAISAAEGPPAYPGISGHEPDAALAARQAEAITRAMDALRPLLPAPAAYLAESDFHQADWQQAFWGTNYPRLLAAKRRYDPEGLFFVHHGVGVRGRAGMDLGGRGVRARRPIVRRRPLLTQWRCC